MCVCVHVCVCTQCIYTERWGKIVIHTCLWLCLVLYSLQSFPVHLIWSYLHPKREEGHLITHFTKEGARTQGGEGRGSRPRWNWLPEQDSDLGFLMPENWLWDNFPILGRVKMAFQSFSMCTRNQSLVCFAAWLFIYWTQRSICHAYWGNESNLNTNVVSKDRTSASKALRWETRLTSPEVTETICVARNFPQALFCSSSPFINDSSYAS